MRALYKILLIIVSALCLVLSVCLLSAYLPIAYLSEGLLEYSWIQQSLAGFCVFLCALFLIFLLVGIFLPARRNTIIFTSGTGSLQFSRKTLESTVRYSFADVDGIVAAKVRVQFGRQPEKTKIHVRLAVDAVTDLVSLTQTVQQRIEAALQSSLGIAVKSIHVRVVEHRPDGLAPTRTGSTKNKAADEPESL